jgi:hypothetical protein
MNVRTSALIGLLGGALVIGAATAGTALSTSSGALASAQLTGSTVSAKSVSANSVSANSGSTNHRIRADLTPSSAQLAACFPKAKARVTVDLTTAAIGKDSFTVQASGLRPKTDFTVFLLEKAGAPFGAAEYIGDFSTDRWGNGTGRFTLIVEEAFAFNNETKARTDLNAVGFWFADPKDDDQCLGANSPVTGFDGDGEAGVQMMNSGTAILP